MNTPESDEVCFDEATQANRDWVEGQQVTLIKDVSDTDQYGRLLRFVYVDDVMVNEVLVHDGWAEAVVYPPDDSQWDYFVRLEKNAAEQGLGCHPTGIFGDGTYER
jgi:micrococcal nuclease